MQKNTNRVVIIGEAGVNHNGDIEMAKKLIDVAASAGVDYVKFQTFKPELCLTATAPQAKYQIANTNVVESQLDMVSRLELSHDAHHILYNYAEEKGVKFLSTAFDIPSMVFLQSFNLDYIKIPSGEITNLPYLEFISQFRKKILLSTGMANLGEIEAAIKVLESRGIARSDITVLHCTTEYPASLPDVNLNVLQTIRNAFKVSVGYSDHTAGIEIPTAAVALGARVIEKHFTLDRNLPGPDHKASLEPNELNALVQAIRNVEMALGDGIKRAMPGELENMQVARKSLVASVDIKCGELFTADNLAVKRPGIGISPMRYHEILGRVATKNIMKDQFIEI